MHNTIFTIFSSLFPTEAPLFAGCEAFKSDFPSVRTTIPLVHSLLNELQANTLRSGQLVAYRVQSHREG